jgi:LemA protein
MTPLYVALALLAFAALLVALSYNHLVRLRNKVTQAWQDVDVQLQRRHDLIPRLVEVVRGYAAHESALFEQLARLRSEAQRASGAAAKSEPESELADALGGAIAVAESYPNLRASQNYLSLQKEIADTEDEISAARFIYNGNVRIFNTRTQTFPVSMYADVFGFEPAEYFQASSPDREPLSAVLGVD